MSYNNIQVFERQERDGWWLVMPLEGNRKMDSSLFNPQAAQILSYLRRGMTPATICKSIAELHQDVSYDRIRLDVYGTTMRLRELGLYDMTATDVEEMCPNPAAKLPGLHVMDDPEISMVVKILQDLYSEGPVWTLTYSLSVARIEDLAAYSLRAMHFNGMHTYLVFNDEQGEARGVITLLGLGAASPVVVVGLLGILHDDSVRRIAIGVDMLTQAAALLQMMTEASKMRFAVYTSDECAKSPSACNGGSVLVADEFVKVVDGAGFRREAALRNEGGRGIDVEYFTRSLLV